MSTCNRLDLQTLGSQPVLLKNLPDHWSGPVSGSGRCLGRIGRGPSVSKSNWPHVVIFLRLFFNNLRNIPHTPRKWSVLFLKSWASTGYISNSTGLSVNSPHSLDLSVFSFLNLRYIPSVPLKWWVNFLTPWTSATDFSNLTGSSSFCWHV